MQVRSCALVLYHFPDVETQWDLYLAKTYSPEALRMKNFEEEQMPTEWFRDWLQQLA
ncbi:hypothetical protein [Terasakiispira papahanaumokuakeensis]|uniref:hypothetical protein n=1 Tax=Terasakiispira papahanaumokuakeensis TaxID=197479 RepID=UPI0015863AAF|nr:hypothetical protein [Terasakiispira papahanaumokuakeensis]